MESVKAKTVSAFEAMRAQFGYKNHMQTPRLFKVVVSTGTGKVVDQRKEELIRERLARITGQKPSPRPAKRSIASFKTRAGDTIGYQVTLRGARMYDFLDKLIHVALPQTRDFRGIRPSAIDAMGNITIGIREHTVFPETADEDIKDVFSLAVTLVTSARSAEEAEVFLRHIGVPLAERATEEAR